MKRRERGYCVGAMLLIWSVTIYAEHYAYNFDPQLSASAQTVLVASIEQHRSNMLSHTQLIEELIHAHPYLATITIQHLPAHTISITVNARVPVLRIVSSSHDYFIDATGTHLAPEHFSTAHTSALPAIHCANDTVVDSQLIHHLLTAVHYAAQHFARWRIELVNAHTLYISNHTPPCTVVCDPYNVPSIYQLVGCRSLYEEHTAKTTASHRKTCRQLVLDTRFNKQIIQSCTKGGSPHDSPTA